MYGITVNQSVIDCQIFSEPLNMLQRNMHKDVTFKE